MARWISKITNAGLALLARTPNNSFVFTKAECGSGTVDTSLLEAQTEVTDFKKALLISSCTNMNNQVKLRIQLNNENVVTGFSLHQVGIYAKLSTDSTDSLFMIIQTDLADFIPSATESPNYVCDYIVNTVISNAASISANVDPAGYVTQGQLEEILAGLEDVELKDSVTQIKQDIGTTADTGGSETGGTVFAKLNKIIHDILGVITNIGKNDDTGNTTIFGILKGFNGSLDRIGFPDDVASTNLSGTVMGKLNSILNLLVGGQAIFDTAGIYSLKIPAGVQKVTITACAGGGGGGGSAELVTSSMVYFKSGGGGSGGCAISEQNYTVTPLSTLSITVGGGGAGGTSERRTSASSSTAPAGVKGGSTIIGNLVTLAGGNPGQGGSFLNSEKTPIASGGTSAGTGSKSGSSGEASYDTINGYPDGTSGGGSGFGGGTILGGINGYGGSGGDFIKTGTEAIAEEKTPVNGTSGRSGYVLIKWGVL